MAFDCQSEIAAVKIPHITSHVHVISHENPPKSFAQVLSGSNCNIEAKLPKPIIQGDVLCIAITEEEYV